MMIKKGEHPVHVSCQCQECFKSFGVSIDLRKCSGCFEKENGLKKKSSWVSFLQFIAIFACFFIPINLFINYKFGTLEEIFFQFGYFSGCIIPIIAEKIARKI